VFPATRPKAAECAALQTLTRCWHHRAIRRASAWSARIARALGGAVLRLELGEAERPADFSAAGGKTLIGGKGRGFLRHVRSIRRLQL